METNNKKKVYQKPEIQEVKLVPEEAVLAACKATTSVARNSAGCDNTRTGCISRTSAGGS